MKTQILLIWSSIIVKLSVQTWDQSSDLYQNYDYSQATGYDQSQSGYYSGQYYDGQQQQQQGYDYSSYYGTTTTTTDTTTTAAQATAVSPTATTTAVSTGW